MRRLAAPHNGSAAQYRALHEPKYRHWLDRLVYLPDLAEADLDDLDGLLITERLHRAKFDAAAGRVLGVLERGATVIFLLGGPPPEWLPGARWEARFRSGRGGWMPTWFLHPGDWPGPARGGPRAPLPMPRSRRERNLASPWRALAARGRPARDRHP